jgi:GTP pyrophosphokinase
LSRLPFHALAPTQKKNGIKTTSATLPHSTLLIHYQQKIMTVDALLNEYRRHFPANGDHGEELIRRAFAFAKNAHKDQKRKSGEEYFSHVFETAKQLARWRLDAASIAAGLLHDSMEDCGVTRETLEKEFGHETAFLVDGVTKLGTLAYREEDANIESLRKMILAISKDLRVVFVKLADRLHNMQTLQFVSPAKQRRIALETSEIYAPIADRLGMQSVAGELEDLAFPYIHPEAYQWLKSNIGESYEERQRYLKKIEPIVREHLRTAGVVPLSIDYRAKRLFSLYKKLMRYDMNLEQIYDLIAMRIIVSTVDECYLALGAIHQLWPPMPGKIKDYIALPKPNGYQSLHTTVFCIGNHPTEFQIRTRAMHEHAENGTAAHWFYESKKHDPKGAQHAIADSKEALWVQQLKEWQNQFPGSQEFIEALKVDFFSDRVFVLTPKGKVIDLPTGATPVDFAYKVHTGVGDSCVGAKVNNKIVPLDFQLQSGDIVQILTQKGKHPSEDWMRFVKTNEAKKKIKASVHKKEPRTRTTEYRIVIAKRIGAAKDILAIFARNKIPISGLRTLDEKSPFPTIKVIADIASRERAEEIIIKIRKVEGVREVGYKII